MFCIEQLEIQNGAIVTVSYDDRKSEGYLIIVR